MLGVIVEVQLSDRQQIQASCQSRAGGQPEFRAMEDANNIGLRAAGSVTMEMLAIRIVCSLVLVTVMFELQKIILLNLSCCHNY